MCNPRFCFSHVNASSYFLILAREILYGSIDLEIFVSSFVFE